MQQTTRPVLLGLVGALLLSAAGWLASPWGLGFAGRDNTLPIRWAHSAPAALGLALLFWAWLGISRLRAHELWRTLALWSAPLLVCPPILSKDAWAYLEQGWIVLQGYNPYLTPLSSIGGPFADRVDSYWQLTTTVYPPLALAIQAAMVAISGAHPLWSLLAMRLPGLLSVVAIGACLPAIARRAGHDPDRAVWLGVANPLVIVHFIGGVHNDAWAVALGVAGIHVAVRWGRWWLAGCVLVGLAMAVKQPLGLMMVAVALIGVSTGRATPPAEAWQRVIIPALWRLPAGLAATAAGFAIPTLVSGWGLGWATGSGAPQTAGSQSVAHTVSSALQKLTGWPMADAVAVVTPIFLGIGAVIIGYLGWRYGARRPITFSAWALVAFAFSYPSLQPWYALWGGVLLGAVVLSERAMAWLIAVVGVLLSNSVLLDYAGWPIPVVQGIALAGLWPLRRLARLAAPAA